MKKCSKKIVSFSFRKVCDSLIVTITNFGIKELLFYLESLLLFDCIPCEIHNSESAGKKRLSIE